MKLRAVFDNQDGTLFPNQFVNTRLLVNTLDEPDADSLVRDPAQRDTDFVYLIADNKATMQTVKPGITDKGNTAVQGINPGDVVANSSFEKLQNGSQITHLQGQAALDFRRREQMPRESVSPIYSAAGRDLAADGRHPAGRHRRLHPVAGLRAA